MTNIQFQEISQTYLNEFVALYRFDFHICTTQVTTMDTNVH